MIIFCETGLVILPILPGDSLLFAAGSIAAIGGMNVHLLAGLLVIAAILGDSINYAIGQFIGPQIFSKENSLLFNKNYLLKAHAFYEKYGGKAIIIARFIPVVRTFAPFVAGIGTMRYTRFFAYNVIGGIFWVCLFIYGSYWFGNIPLVKQNFSLVIMVIILLSILPPVIEFLRTKYSRA
tara:strand:- start:28 stop:567 length:540 start_codon:yes stop_codon:yes gene_type:complete